MPTIDDHLLGRPESVADMFSEILSTAQDRGHVDTEVIAKGVVLHGSRRIFAELVPTDRGLGGMLNLPMPRQDARFTKVEALTKRIWHHRFSLPIRASSTRSSWAGSVKRATWARAQLRDDTTARR